MNDVFAKRAARIAFGIVLLLGMAALLDFAIAEGAHTPRGVHAWHIIVGSWLAAAIAAVVVWAVTVVRRPPRNSDALRRAALSVPAIGIALLLPLTLHLPFALNDLTAFDTWAVASLVVVGHVHLIFAFLVWRRARALTGNGRPITVARIYILTCIAAAFPFILPSPLVALTGIPVAALLVRMKTIAENDREHSHAVPFAIAT